MTLHTLWSVLTTLSRLAFAAMAGILACDLFAFSVVYAGVFPPVWVLALPFLPVAILAHRYATRRGWFR